jgi:predicted phosphoribosyltransferase
MSDFADLRDGGRALGPHVVAAMAGVSEPLLLACIPNGVPVALGIRETFDAPVRALPVERSDAGAVVAPVADLAGRNVIVVDDGVETGTVARAAVLALLDSGVESVVLAVPVCAREAEASLQHRFDRIIAVVRPFVHRSLAGHYATFDTIDETEAYRLLDSLRPS